MRIDGFLKVIGIPGSDEGSRARNFYSYLALLTSVILSILTIAGFKNQFSLYTALLFCFLVFWFFYKLVVVVIFLITDEFKINPLRLIRDICISAFYTISAFGYLISNLGIVGPDKIKGEGLDYVYFSIVTFSTLGYGDFRPSISARMPAAIEALIGNLHLGLIAGATFLLIAEIRAGYGEK